MPHIVQISVNPKGGVPKHRVAQALLKTEGVDGDKQRDKRFHGGPERAVCLFSYERIQALQNEGHPIDCGTTGENLTIAGLNWDEIVPGVHLQMRRRAVGNRFLYITVFSHCRFVYRRRICAHFTKSASGLEPRLCARAARRFSQRRR